MYKVIVLASWLILVTPSFAQENVAEVPKFESDAAKAAITRFQEKLEFLDEKLSEQIDEARKEMITDLEKALASAVEKKDFAEVQRISAFIESKTLLTKETHQSEQPPIVRQLQEQVRELKAELARVKRSAPADDAFYQTFAGSTYRITFTEGSGQTITLTYNRDGTIGDRKVGARWTIVAPNLVACFNPQNRNVDLLLVNEDGTECKVFGLGKLNPAKGQPGVLVSRDNTDGRTRR